MGIPGASSSPAKGRPDEDLDSRDGVEAPAAAAAQSTPPESSVEAAADLGGGGGARRPASQGRVLRCASTGVLGQHGAVLFFKENTLCREVKSRLSAKNLCRGPDSTALGKDSLPRAGQPGSRQRTFAESLMRRLSAKNC